MEPKNLQSRYVTGLKSSLASRFLRDEKRGADARARNLMRDFVSSAAINNLYELRSTELALRKAPSEEVRDLAQLILNDHRQSSQRLQSTLKMAGMADTDVAVPYQLDFRREGMMEHLELLSEREFGPMFIRQQKMTHEESLGFFRNYAAFGASEALKDFADITLRFLECRLTHVLRIA